MDLMVTQTLDFLRASQNADGGWGYRPGGTSWVEPTAFASLALGAAGPDPQALRGLEFLKRCRQPDGAIGLGLGSRDGCWAAYAALLAFHGLGARPEEEKAKDWILKFVDSSSGLPPETLRAIQQEYRIDPSIPGWPWIRGTSNWVESTSLFMIALAASDVPVLHVRVQAGIDLLLDRALPSGGWNFGNPFIESHEMDPSLLSTSLALAALGAYGLTEGTPAVSKGIRAIVRLLAGDAGTMALAWSITASRLFPSASAHAPAAASRLASRRLPNGSYRDNPFETALAHLAAEKPEMLLRGIRKPQ